MRRSFTLFVTFMACAIAALAQSRYAAHSALGSGRWVKVRVASEGVYQLTAADVKKMGFSNPGRVRLYGSNVPVLPETRLESMPDDMAEIPVLRKDDGTMLFYSPGTTQWTVKGGKYVHKHNPYSLYIYYMLTDDGAAEPLKLAKSEVAEARRTMATFRDHALVEKDEWSFINAGRTFFESYNFGDGSTRSYTIPLPGIASGDVSLAVQYAAAGSLVSQLTVSAEGNQLMTLNFAALPDYEYADVRSGTAVWRNVVSDQPVLRLSHPCAAGMSGHLDYIRATYERKLDIGKDGWLAFHTDENARYAATITGANSSTRVLRVTSPALTEEQHSSFADGSCTAVVTPSETGSDVFVAINTDASFPSPETVGSVANQDLHAIEDIDLVIITPANGKFNAEAQRLADAHAELDGMKCAVVQADWIYNEFSSGTPDITAYRRFLKMLYDRSGGRCPRNVLLFGRCVWDNRMVTSTMRGQQPDDYLLCYESDNSVSHTNSYISEEYITLLADGKGVSPLKEKPDCGVGRLPVGNAAEARAVVSKIIRYMRGGDYGAWLNTIAFLADDGNANMHGEDAENVWEQTSRLYPDYRYKKIYWDAHEAVKSSTGTSYPDTYAEINKVMNEGALIMNYTGHGAAYCLSHEQVLKTSDFQGWQSPRLPLWLTAGCDIMPFDMNATNIGVEAVMNPGGAAIGFVGTARTVYASQNRRLNRYFMKRVLDRKPDGTRFTIGEALAAAKSDIIQNREVSSKTDSINKVHFALVGDPAITLPTPELSVKIDKINGKAAADADMQTISAGATVTIDGYVADTQGNIVDDFYGLVSPTMLDCIETIVCKDNDGSAGKINKEPLTYQDRTRVLFNGSDSIRAGRFSISFPVPLDISYANDNGLIHLFAIDTSRRSIANGSYRDFILGGTADVASADTVGPAIALYLDSPYFVHSGKTGTTPTLYAALSDSSGINTSGAGLGHDITAIIDGNEQTTYTLGQYYTQSIGDHRSGTVTFTFPALSEGKHTLTLRAFDTFNNMSEVAVVFEVIDGLQQYVDYYDLAGRQVAAGDDTMLPKGIYIKRVWQVSPAGVASEHAEKVFVR